MQAAVSLNATYREQQGKGATRALRRMGKVPAVVYGDSKPNVSIAIDANVIEREYYLGGMLSKLVQIDTGKEKMFVLPKAMQLHPVTDRIVHIDFLQVNEQSSIKAVVPVRFLNADRCIGLKRGGNLNIVRHELELICGVNNIPRVIEIDIAKMNIGESLHISAVALPEGVSPAIKDRDFTIATIAGRGGKQDKEDTASDEAATAGEGEKKA